VRFTLVKKLEKDSAMKPIMVGLLVFMFMFLVSDIFVKEANFGLNKQSISYTLFGNEEEFLDPMVKSVFLEFIHSEIFFIMMILLTLSAIFARVSNRSKFNLLVINGVMIFALAALVSLGLAYFYSPIFVESYVFCSFTWNILAFYMLFYSLWKLNAKSL